MTVDKGSSKTSEKEQWFLDHLKEIVNDSKSTTVETTTILTPTTTTTTTTTTTVVEKDIKTISKDFVTNRVFVCSFEEVQETIEELKHNVRCISCRSQINNLLKDSFKEAECSPMIQAIFDNNKSRDTSQNLASSHISNSNFNNQNRKINNDNKNCSRPQEQSNSMSLKTKYLNASKIETLFKLYNSPHSLKNTSHQQSQRRRCDHHQTYNTNSNSNSQFKTQNLSIKVVNQMWSKLSRAEKDKILTITNNNCDFGDRHSHSHRHGTFNNVEICFHTSKLRDNFERYLKSNSFCKHCSLNTINAYKCLMKGVDFRNEDDDIEDTTTPNDRSDEEEEECSTCDSEIEDESSGLEENVCSKHPNRKSKNKEFNFDLSAYDLSLYAGKGFFVTDKNEIKFDERSVLNFIADCQTDFFDKNRHATSLRDGQLQVNIFMGLQFVHRINQLYTKRLSIIQSERHLLWFILQTMRKKVLTFSEETHHLTSKASVDGSKVKSNVIKNELEESCNNITEGNDSKKNKRKRQNNRRRKESKLAASFARAEQESIEGIDVINIGSDVLSEQVNDNQKDGANENIDNVNIGMNVDKDSVADYLQISIDCDSIDSQDHERKTKNNHKKEKEPKKYYHSYDLDMNDTSDGYHKESNLKSKMKWCQQREKRLLDRLFFQIYNPVHLHSEKNYGYSYNNNNNGKGGEENNEDVENVSRSNCPNSEARIGANPKKSGKKFSLSHSKTSSASFTTSSSSSSSICNYLDSDSEMDISLDCSPLTAEEILKEKCSLTKAKVLPISQRKLILQQKVNHLCQCGDCCFKLRKEIKS